MLTSDILLADLDTQGILRLTLNDQRRRNTLSETMLTKLRVTFENASADPAVHVIVLTATGPAFCAKHDLKEMTAGRAGDDDGKAYFTHVMSLCAGIMQDIMTCSKPMIAEVTGVATVAGCQLVTNYDLAITADTTQFSTPGMHISLFCSTPMIALSRSVANKHAMEMLLTGDMMSATRAAEIGLVNHVMAPDTLHNATMQIALKIASKSSMTLATGKHAYYTQREMTLDDTYDYTSDVMVDNMLAQDTCKDIDAFIEKHRPK